MNKFSKLKALTLAEWQALLCALVMLPVVALLLRMIGYNRTMTLLNKTIPGAQVPVNTPCNPLPPGEDRVRETGAGDNQLTQARQLARIVSIAATHGPYHANCLKQSLVLYWMLARRRIPAEIRFGVYKEATQEFNAHAWVEYAGINLCDNDVIQQQIVPFPIVPDARPKNGHLQS